MAPRKFETQIPDLGWLLYSLRPTTMTVMLGSNYSIEGDGQNFPRIALEFHSPM